jgi:hypothetical protein
LRLEPLYRVTFRYPDGGHGTVLEGEAGSEGHYFFVAEGEVTGRIAGRISIPDDRAESLIQPAGISWREFHNVTLTWIGGVAVLGMMAIIVMFYLSKGRIHIDAGRSCKELVWVAKSKGAFKPNRWYD